MKKLAFISGATSISLISMELLFKLMHWPYAGLLLPFSIGLFALVFIPTITKHLYDREK